MKSWNLKVEKIGKSWLFKFSDQDEEVIVDGSYIFDPVNQLFTAIRLILKGEQESEAPFLEEPGEKLIHFRQNNEDLMIRIYEFEEYRGIGRNKEAGKLRMQMMVNKNKFLNRLINEFYPHRQDDEIQKNLDQIIELRK